MRSRLIAALFVCLFGQPAVPAWSSDTYRQEGVSLRLALLPADATGRVRGALSIDLDPGWKTYWISPGPVGLAPRLDISSSADLDDARWFYPVPSHFAEGSETSIGYNGPTAFAFSGQAGPTFREVRIDLTMGICRELCVPVSATLTARPSTSLSDRALVASAEAALPDESGPLAPLSARWTAGMEALQIELPAAPLQTTQPGAFVSGPAGWTFGAPVPADRSPPGTSRTFALPVLARPSSGDVPSVVDLLLTSGEIAQLSRGVRIEPH